MKDFFNSNMIANEQEQLIETRWSEAWSSGLYRKNFLTVSTLFTIVLLCYPYFFASIQKREGHVLNDWILHYLPSADVSVYIFSLIYITVCVGIFRAAQSPNQFLTFLWGCLLLSLSRMITITVFPLEPPSGLVPLVDPVLKAFYGHDVITKDLFFSGHTSSLFLIYMVVKKNWEKVMALTATILVGMLLLVQHIHYVLDVVAAPVFVYFIFLLAKKLSAFSLTD